MDENERVKVYQQIYDLTVSNNKKDKEIERLNNIIEELEKWAKEQKEYNDTEYPKEFNDYEDVLNKIQELKGSDKE